MQRTRLILVGGFLGAGKTTLLGQAARVLTTQGKRVGLITNDQAANLVDTELLRREKLNVREIAGGCFCCRFEQLMETAHKLRDAMSPDIIIGEPVGSCTDLSATVVQPIKAQYADVYCVSPLSVLVDPSRLQDLLGIKRQGLLHASVRYILQKQIEEADLLVINKRDSLTVQEQQDIIAATRNMFPGKPVFLVSALTGDGVTEWLNSVVNEAAAGAYIADVDYDIYSEGEAVLGWLNAAATVSSPENTDWQALSLCILNRIKEAALQAKAEIAHVKLALSAASGHCVANITSTAGAPMVRGQIIGESPVVSLVVNARVEMAPDLLQNIVEGIFAALVSDGFTVQLETMQSFRPGRPLPMHRYTSVVAV